MPVNNQELLIDHLDKKLQGESLPEAEALLQSDSNAREEWQYLQSAVDAVEHHALHAQVAAIRAEMSTGAVRPSNVLEGGDATTVVPAGSRPAMKVVTEAPAAPVQKPISSITRNIFRIAAAIVLLVGSLVVYKFATVNANDFYNRHYTSYELPTSRGGVETASIELAYRNADWNAVINLYNSLAVKRNQDHFLAGIASLELKQFPQAIERFTQILNINAAGNDTWFQDEAEYYLALAYIANNEIAKASTLLDKIKADSNHLYREKAADMSGTDFKVLELK
jgi:tetratricopeptide (TPR) repeat protein